MLIKISGKKSLNFFWSLNTIRLSTQMSNTQAINLLATQLFLSIIIWNLTYLKESSGNIHGATQAETIKQQ